MNENARVIEEDEIDLAELFKTLMKRKWFIVVFTGIITLTALVYVFIKTPMYDAKALVEIGSYKLYNNNNNRIELDNPSQLSQKLNVLFIDMYKNKKDRKATITSISVPKRQKTFIEIKSLAVNNKLAKQEIEKVVDYIQKSHQKILDDVKRRRELEIKNIDAKISNIKNKQIAILSEKIALQSKNLNSYRKQLVLINANLKKIEKINPTLAALKLMEKRDLSSFIVSLNLQLMDMRNKKDELKTTAINSLLEKRSLLFSMLLPYNYKNSEIVGSIITNNYPVKQKKKLIVIVAFVTGFIVSVFLVFFMEFIQNIKEESR